MRVVNIPADDHSVVKDSLIVRTCFFSDASDGSILDAHDNFHSDQADLFESIARCQFCRTDGNSFAATTGPHPVAQITKVIDGMDVTQAAAPEDYPAFFGDRKCV